MRSDTELLAGLEKACSEGAAPAIVNDDGGHWACVGEGWQTVPCTMEPEDVITTFVIPKNEWRASLRGAIEAFLDDHEAHIDPDAPPLTLAELEQFKRP